MEAAAVKLIDEALIRMRKLWSPVTSGRRASGVEPLVDLSTVLVVDAVSRLGDTPSIAHLATHLAVARPTASRIVDKAVSTGFVAKRPAADDVRRRELSLTPEGRELLNRSLEFRLAYVGLLVDAWREDEIVTFSRLLSRFADAVAENPPDPSNPPAGVEVRFDKTESFAPPSGSPS